MLIISIKTNQKENDIDSGFCGRHVNYLPLMKRYKTKGIVFSIDNTIYVHLSQYIFAIACCNI